MQTIRVVCAHDCPDMCSMLAQVEDGRVVRIQGDPANPLTAGFACAKVNRDHELVHSPRAPGDAACAASAPRARASSQPISWDAALDEIVDALEGDHRRVGTAGAARLRLQRPPGPDQPRPGQRPVPCARRQPAAGRHGVRHLLRDGLGPHRRPGRRRRSRDRSSQSDLIISWGADLMATNVHFWAEGGGGAQDGRAGHRHRSAPQPHGPARRLAHPDPHRHRRRAGARHHAHPGARRPVRPRATSPRTRSASTGSRPRCCRASRRPAWPRSPGSTVGRRRAPRGHVRAGQGAPSSASARA